MGTGSKTCHSLAVLGLAFVHALTTGCRPPAEAPKHAPGPAGQTRESAARPPNIILILTDDQAPGTLGCEGNPHVRTPRLDRLAKEGAYFSRAYVPVPQCAPSRAALLTGLYPPLNGVLSNTDPQLNPDLTTFPELFKRQGYACGLVGKWHLGNGLQPQCGFEDLWVTYLLPEEDRPVPRISYDPRLYVNGQWVAHKGYLTDILTDYAIHFVEDHVDHPFLLWLAYKAPHPPYDPPPDARLSYEASVLPLPGSIADDLSTKPSPQRGSRAHRLFKQNSPVQIRRFLGAYYAMISSVDQNVARLLDRLDQLQLDRDTLIIYMSDNGFLHGEHQMLTKGAAFYEELVRTPLILRWPGRIESGTRVDALVSSLDIFPTLCRAADIPLPTHLSGKDLRPLLAGEYPALRETLFFEYHTEMLSNQVTPMRGLVTPRYKYVNYLQDTEELYDLEVDPREMQNLISDPEREELADSLRQKLVEWQSEMGAGLSPAVRPSAPDN